MCLRVGSKALVKFGTTSVKLQSGTVLKPRTIRIAVGPESTAWCYGFDGGIEIEHTYRPANGHGVLDTAMTCKNPEPVCIAMVTIGEGSQIHPKEKMRRVYWQTAAMDGFSGIEDAPERFDSWGMCGFTDPRGTSAFVTGFGEFSRYCCEIGGNRPEGEWQIEGRCHLESLELKQGETAALPPLLFSAGPSLAGLLEHYASWVAQRMGASRPLPPSPAGWCSWYCYYGRETETDILENLDCFGSLPGQHGAMFFQIDDGWNLPHPGHPRVWGDWQPGEKFSHGMQWIASQIEKRGFIPGLWLAPFSVDSTSQFAATRPGLMIQAQNETTGKLEPASVENDGKRFILDLTHPGAIQFIRETFHRVFKEWGFRYVKLDFLQHALAPGIRHNPRQTPIESFRAALRTIREVAGDEAFILCCGSPFGPSIGLCDGMRVGFDVGGGWDAPLLYPSWPDGNCCVKAAAKPAFYRHWMHRKWWINDPDCLIARSQPLGCEVEELAKIAQVFGKPGPAPKFCLDDSEAACWVRFVWMLGGFALSSEILPTLPADRRELLREALHPNSQPTLWIDWYMHPELCLLRTTTAPLLVGIFNFSDQPQAVELPASKLDLAAWKFAEKFDRGAFSGQGAAIAFPTLPPHSGRIWQLEA